MTKQNLRSKETNSYKIYTNSFRILQIHQYEANEEVLSHNQSIVSRNADTSRSEFITYRNFVSVRHSTFTEHSIAENNLPSSSNSIASVNNTAYPPIAPREWMHMNENLIPTTPQIAEQLPSFDMLLWALGLDDNVDNEPSNSYSLFDCTDQ